LRRIWADWREREEGEREGEGEKGLEYVVGNGGRWDGV
jgi:hypothetical protein